MRVLIADDDKAACSALVRILSAKFDYTYVEAATGIEALERLAEGTVAFAILDLGMPLLSGLEVLEAVRSSTTLNKLPILMVSGCADEEAVRAVIQLGVSGFLTKPLRAERVFDRIGQILREQSNPLDRAGAGGKRSVPVPSPATSLMILDSDPEYRHFFINMLGARAPIVQAERGSQALAMCLEACPAAVFVGRDTGLLKPEAFVRKLRSTDSLSSIPVVGVLPAAALARGSASDLYDAVIPRTFVPEVFDLQLRGICERPTAFAELVALYPSLTVNMLSATEQAFGMMAHCELSLNSQASPDTRAAIGSRVRMEIDGSRLALDVALRCSVEAAGVLTARLLGIADTGVAHEDVQAATAELLNVITGRLQKGFVECGVQAKCSLPAPLPRDEGLIEAPRDITFVLDAAEPDLSVCLTAVAHRRAGPPPSGRGSSSALPFFGPDELSALLGPASAKAGCTSRP
jgi:CheY-like chemotaxis protein